jgi:flagellar hook protein FlgE
MQAAETQVDVAGNNLANSQTVGFKASETQFATQFLQTYSLGSAPTDTSGGTNPRQSGLGTRVAAVSPDFTQGAIEISSGPADLAIQGDGFFMVESSEGERLYTRNGIFKTNAENELVNVTGQRVLGFGIDENYEVQRTTLEALTIPLGTAATAQATRNVFLQGVLSPAGDLADTAGVIESTVLGDAAVPRPDIAVSTVGVHPLPIRPASLPCRPIRAERFLETSPIATASHSPTRTATRLSRRAKSSSTCRSATGSTTTRSL